MKALTIIQPWATLAAIEVKHIETRGWPTSYRGPLALHAAKGFPEEAQSICFEPHYYSALKQAGYIHLPKITKYSRFWIEHVYVPRGCIVATCDLVEVAGPIDLATSWHGCKEHWKNKHCFSLTEQERAFGDYSVGRYLWLLENVKALPEPIPTRGAQGLWEWNENA